MNIKMIPDAISFRGKDKNGQWVYGSLLKKVCADGSEVFEIIPDGHHNGKEVSKDSIGFHSGFVDIDKNPIYAGDVLAVYKDPIGIVVWDDWYNGFILLDGDCEAKLSQGLINEYEYKIIGNIVDNPEYKEVKNA